MLFNINHYVRVRLNDLGRKIHRECWTPFCVHHAYSPPEEDADGWSRFQMWELMATFGPNLGNGMNVPFETTIDIVENQS